MRPSTAVTAVVVDDGVTTTVHYQDSNFVRIRCKIPQFLSFYPNRTAIRNDIRLNCNLTHNATSVNKQYTIPQKSNRVPFGKNRLLLPFAFCLFVLLLFSREEITLLSFKDAERCREEREDLDLRGLSAKRKQKGDARQQMQTVTVKD